MLSLLFCSCLLHFVCLAKTLLFDEKNCTFGKPFFCPENCLVTWFNGCPRSCTCYPPTFCPEVKCPAPPPGCLLVTQQSGCQTCLCSQAVIEVKSTSLTNVNDTDFILIDKRRFSRAKAEGCTDVQTKNVDQCLRRFGVERNNAKEKPEPGITTFLPFVELQRSSLSSLCEVYDEALSCIGQNVFNDCALRHFELAKINALYGYICGPQSVRFSVHYPCLQEARKAIRRTKLCENLLASALIDLYVNSTETNEKYVERKCEALKWYAACVRPDISRFCSKDAAESVVEAVHSMSVFIEPTCDATLLNLDDYFFNQTTKAAKASLLNHKNVTSLTNDSDVAQSGIGDRGDLIEKKPANPDDIVALNSHLLNAADSPFDNEENLTSARQSFINVQPSKIKNVTFSAAFPPVIDPLTGSVITNELFSPADARVNDKEIVECDFESRQLINAKYSYFLYEIRDYEKDPAHSLVYPSIFSYSKDILTDKCHEYRLATEDIPESAKLTCDGRYDVFDQVKNTLSYACSFGTEATFRTHFNCLELSRKESDVQRCENQTIAFLKDPSANQCDSRILFAQCVRSPTISHCGDGGWRNLFQLMNLTMANTFGSKCFLPFGLDGELIS